MLKMKYSGAEIASSEKRRQENNCWTKSSQSEYSSPEVIIFIADIIVIFVFTELIFVFIFIRS